MQKNGKMVLTAALAVAVLQISGCMSTNSGSIVDNSGSVAVGSGQLFRNDEFERNWAKEGDPTQPQEMNLNVVQLRLECFERGKPCVTETAYLVTNYGGNKKKGSDAYYTYEGKDGSSIHIFRYIDDPHYTIRIREYSDVIERRWERRSNDSIWSNDSTRSAYLGFVYSGRNYTRTPYSFSEQVTNVAKKSGVTFDPKVYKTKESEISYKFDVKEAGKAQSTNTEQLFGERRDVTRKLTATYTVTFSPEKIESLPNRLTQNILFTLTTTTMGGVYPDRETLHFTRDVTFVKAGNGKSYIPAKVDYPFTITSSSSQSAGLIGSANSSRLTDIKGAFHLNGGATPQ